MTLLLAAAYFQKDHDWVAVPLFSEDRSAPDLETEAQWLDLEHLQRGSHGWLILRDALPMLALTSDRRIHRLGHSQPWGADTWSALTMCIAALDVCASE